MQAIELAAKPGVRRGIAGILTGGVIVNVSTADQARIAEDAGAVAVMAFEHVPDALRNSAGQPGRSDLEVINHIKSVVSIPVVARTYLGHSAHATMLQSLGVDYIDESEHKTSTTAVRQSDKRHSTVPFMASAASLGDVLRRINEGAAMIRCRSEQTGATDGIRQLRAEIDALSALSGDLLREMANNLGIPYELAKEVGLAGKFPVALFAESTENPADAALMMQLGADGVLVGPAIFKLRDPGERVAALANAVTFHDEPAVIAKISRDVAHTLR
ncbi:pyridoxal 5'-phosphate synthase lyase subunit PdxS [Paenarthrobacter ureafaciens]|uniref:pyridoxal 5'-phosphate synthase lyase subunit PdxS n=1 Tax=Paenarthrobacter ureafaciens TaxID=37931 RepID=UPI001407E165|nr:pyridoxal 5'-phosphate synthase lyase subunit PdxS [Paenarthrobacter ureafaciens]MCX8453691.1 pyridoxal 5'-phosphate synthase lyase subunit PdxS [Paenarthrobacter ureafaciens]MCY0973350.1 pyridoxal 5'-phosphate synthase lyase subunit PdxS [Paenarthrobacter ureafaciens]